MSNIAAWGGMGFLHQASQLFVCYETVESGMHVCRVLSTAYLSERVALDLIHVR